MKKYKFSEFIEFLWIHRNLMYSYNSVLLKNVFDKIACDAERPENRGPHHFPFRVMSRSGHRADILFITNRHGRSNQYGSVPFLLVCANTKKLLSPRWANKFNFWRQNLIFAAKMKFLTSKFNFAAKMKFLTSRKLQYHHQTISWR